MSTHVTAVDEKTLKRKRDEDALMVDAIENWDRKKRSRVYKNLFCFDTTEERYMHTIKQSLKILVPLIDKDIHFAMDAGKLDTTFSFEELNNPPLAALEIVRRYYEHTSTVPFKVTVDNNAKTLHFSWDMF